MTGYLMLRARCNKISCTEADLIQRGFSTLFMSARDRDVRFLRLFDLQRGHMISITKPASANTYPISKR
jgi:hypothetical protein